MNPLSLSDALAWMHDHDDLKRAQKLPVDVQVRFATEREIIETWEGPVPAEPGDAVITAKGGDQWPVSSAVFAAKYEVQQPASFGQDGTYRAIPREVSAVQLTQPVSVQINDAGHVLNGKAQDWLLDYKDGRLGVVASDIFANTYEVLYSPDLNLHPDRKDAGYLVLNIEGFEPDNLPGLLRDAADLIAKTPDIREAKSPFEWTQTAPGTLDPSVDDGGDGRVRIAFNLSSEDFDDSTGGAATVSKVLLDRANSMEPNSPVAVRDGQGNLVARFEWRIDESDNFANLRRNLSRFQAA